MTEPVANRQAIRRAVGMRARMPFFLAYGETDVTAVPATTTVTNTSEQFFSANLTQPENFWQNSWAFISDTAGVFSIERRIQSFERSNHRVTLEWPLATTMDEDCKVEIYNIWSPSQIHQAINTAIDEGGEYWPEQVVDESMILVEDRLSYDVSSAALSKIIWKPLQLWIERAKNSVTGTCTSACTSTVLYIDSDDDLSGWDTDWYISIYDGTAKGQIRSFVTASTTANTITFVSSTDYFSTNPDSTSKYRWWDADEQWHDWIPLTTVHFNRKEYPDRMYLRNLLTSSYGLRMRQKYLTWPAELTADSEETLVPKEFLVNKALAILHDSLIGDNRVDRQMHGSSAQYYADRAAEYARLHRRRVPAGTLWQTEDDEPHVTSRGDEVGDPLRWWG